MGNIVQDSARSCAAIWGRVNRSLKGKPYGFVDYNNPWGHRPFLVLPLCSTAKVKGCKKSRQAGGSENFVTEILWALDNYPMNIVYTFPSPRQVEDFSNTRVKPVLQEPGLARMVHDPQNVTLKKLGGGYLFLRTASAERFGEGVDADVVVFDEIDRMKPNIRVAFKESLSASKWGWIREVSTPSLPQRGIDELWQKSNQFHWFVRCEACGREQHMRFPDNILELKPVSIFEKSIPPGSYAYCCRFCHSQKLNRWDGRWVAKYPSRAAECYHLSQLMCVWISADEIMQKKKDYRFPQLFHNYVLGETYLGNSQLLTVGVLERHINTELKPTAYRHKDYPVVSVGIDWGATNYAVALGLHNSGRIDLLGLSVAEDTDEPLASVKELVRQFKGLAPDVIVADWGYGKDRVNYLLGEYPGQVYGCTYLDNSRVVEPRFSENNHTVQMDRTAWLKGVSNQVKEGLLSFPDYYSMEMLQVFFEQMCNAAVVLEEEEAGNITERVVNIGEDHFFHSFGYAMSGLEAPGVGAGGFGWDFLVH